MRGDRATIVAVEKLLRITYHECVYVALGIQYVIRMRRTICRLWFVPLYHIFPYYLINRKIFGKKNLLDIKCVFLESL
jgi:hypothetical protein